MTNAAAQDPDASRTPLINRMPTSASDYAPLFTYGPAMQALWRGIEQVAGTNATVLIRGESGVGKEIVAKAIHVSSPRRHRPFVKVNCAALPAELLESELFGHERGAFTGAYRRKPGKFELAHQGSIFLDEIGDLPLPLQAKLLHVLQDSTYARVGGGELLSGDARVIASTNRDLEAAVRQGQFREDLYYRLKVVSFTVPPLRERRTEIAALARSFVQRFNREYGRDVVLSLDALALLTQYAWPGNVRELENMMKRVVVLQDEQILCDECATPAPPAAQTPETPLRVSKETLRELARRAALEAEREAIREVLDAVRWNRAEAARLLKISYKGLLYKMDRCGLARKRARPPREAGASSGDAA